MKKFVTLILLGFLLCIPFAQADLDTFVGVESIDTFVGQESIDEAVGVTIAGGAANAVELTGSVFSTTIANGGGSIVDNEVADITIPADNEMTIVVIGGDGNGTTITVDQLNWNGDDADVDFAEIVSSQDDDDSSFITAYRLLQSDGDHAATGSGKTLYFSLNATNNWGLGSVVVIFVKNVKDSAPIDGTTDTGYEGDGFGVNWTATLSGSLTSNDMAFIAGLTNTTDLDGSSNGQTEAYDADASHDCCVAYELGESGPSLVNSSPTYAAGVAFAVTGE